MSPEPTAPRFETRAADWLSVDEALGRVLARASPLQAERVPLGAALGRALAEPVTATADLPPWDNSAMDGYAVRGQDIEGARAERPVALRVIGVARAGDTSPPTLGSNDAVRIMTGAPIPPNADSVVRVEDTDGEPRAGRVHVLNDRDRGRNVRPGGQDMRAGDLLLEPGRTITPGVVGLLAAAGRAHVDVHRAPTLAVLVTGDELRAPDRYEEVRAGWGVPESNGPMLAAMAREAGASVLGPIVAPDDEAALARAVDEARESDVLVTVGGASMGEADLVKRVLDRLGLTLDFWRVRMRPGSPVSFGRLAAPGAGRPVFGLPGNPASAFVTFEVFVRPFLRALAGHERVLRPVVRAVAGEPLTAAPGLTHFLRVRLSREGGARVVRSVGPQGSGLVRGLASADALAVLPEGVERVEPGADVDVVPLACAEWTS